MSADETEHIENRIRQHAKLALRSRMRAVRAALPKSACDQRSAEINERVLALQEFERAATLLTFASIHNEVRTRLSIEAAWAAGKRVALPRVAGDELQLHVVDSETTLIDGAFSVPEPTEEAERVPPAEIDLAIIPALAVDPRGYRIGYGGGFYDKLIPQLCRACTCAVAYDFQLVSEVPELAFDVPVDIVVTDQRVIRTA